MLIGGKQIKKPPWSVFVTFSVFAYVSLFFIASPMARAGEEKSYRKNKEACCDYRNRDASGSSPFWRDLDYYCTRYEVDINLWKPYVALEDFAYTNVFQTPNLPISAQSSKIPFNWNWGFRLGAGWQFFHEDWEVFASYTYFKGKGKREISNKCGNAIIPLKGVTLLGQMVSKANSNLHLLWNNIDLVANKRFHFNENLLVFTGLGLKNYWFDLKQKTQYAGGAFLNNNILRVDQSSKFYGIGPLLQVRSKWLFINSFYLDGGLGGSLLYGKNRTSFKESLNYSTVNQVKISDDVSYVVPNVDLEVGIGWSKYYDDCSRFVSISLMYENHYFWQQNQMVVTNPYRFNGNFSPRYHHFRGDASFQGFSLKLNFKY